MSPPPATTTTAAATATPRKSVLRTPGSPSKGGRKENEPGHHHPHHHGHHGHHGQQLQQQQQQTPRRVNFSTSKKRDGEREERHHGLGALGHHDSDGDTDMLDAKLGTTLVEHHHNARTPLNTGTTTPSTQARRSILVTRSPASRRPQSWSGRRSRVSFSPSSLQKSLKATLLTQTPTPTAATTPPSLATTPAPSSCITPSSIQRAFQDAVANTAGSGTKRRSKEIRTPVRTGQVDRGHATMSAGRRRGHHNTPGSAEPHGLLGKSPGTLMEKFEEDIRMYTDNKINRETAWDSLLIDYFTNGQILRDSSGRIDFPKASRALDGSVKVYVNRIESVFQDVNKLVTGLASKDETKFGTTSSEQAAARRIRRKSKRGSGTQFLEPAENLKRKDATVDTDPMLLLKSCTRNRAGKHLEECAPAAWLMNVLPVHVTTDRPAEMEEGDERNAKPKQDLEIIFDGDERGVEKAWLDRPSDVVHPSQDPIKPMADPVYGDLQRFVTTLLDHFDDRPALPGLSAVERFMKSERTVLDEQRLHEAIDGIDSDDDEEQDDYGRDPMDEDVKGGPEPPPDPFANGIVDDDVLDQFANVTGQDITAVYGDDDNDRGNLFLPGFGDPSSGAGFPDSAAAAAESELEDEPQDPEGRAQVMAEGLREHVRRQLREGTAFTSDTMAGDEEIDPIKSFLTNRNRFGYVPLKTKRVPPSKFGSSRPPTSGNRPKRVRPAFSFFTESGVPKSSARLAPRIPKTATGKPAHAKAMEKEEDCHLTAKDRFLLRNLRPSSLVEQVNAVTGLPEEAVYRCGPSEIFGLFCRPDVLVMRRIRTGHQKGTGTVEGDVMDHEAEQSAAPDGAQDDNGGGLGEEQGQSRQQSSGIIDRSFVPADWPGSDSDEGQNRLSVSRSPSHARDSPGSAVLLSPVAPPPVLGLPQDPGTQFIDAGDISLLPEPVHPEQDGHRDEARYEMPDISAQVDPPESPRARRLHRPQPFPLFPYFPQHALVQQRAQDDPYAGTGWSYRAPGDREQRARQLRSRLNMSLNLNVDVKDLKDKLWQTLKAQDSSTSLSHLLRATPKPRGLVEAKPPSGKSFQQKKEDGKLLPLLFYTLLHLANENGLELETEGRDVRVVGCGSERQGQKVGARMEE